MSSRSPGELLKRLTLEDLTTLTIKIMRKNVTNVSTNTKLSREIGDPRLLVKSVHHREDEGLRPIFDRDDIIVNKDHGPEERVVRHKEEVHPKESKRKFISRTSKVSPPSSSAGRSDQPSTSRRSSRSPSHRQWDYNNKRYRGGTRADEKSRSRSPPYKSSPKVKRERSRSPSGRGRRSRSPPSRRDERYLRGRYSSRSPHKYKDPPEKRKSSRSPHSRARSKTRSPTHRSRRSRTPDRRYSPQRRYERNRSRSRGRRDHTPERRRRSPHRDQGPVRVPEYPTFYEGDEYWIQGALPPRFLPRGFIPGAFPRGMPGPILVHPRMPPVLLPPTGPPFVPPIGPPVRPVRLPIYNSKNLRPRAPAVQQHPTPTTTSSSGATVTSSNAIEAASSSSSSKDENQVVASEGQEQQVEQSLVSPKAENL